jgi:hypothetical protein
LLFVLDILHKYRYPKKGNIRPVFYQTKTVGIAHHQQSLSLYKTELVAAHCRLAFIEE